MSLPLQMMMVIRMVGIVVIVICYSGKQTMSIMVLKRTPMVLMPSAPVDNVLSGYSINESIDNRSVCQSIEAINKICCTGRYWQGENKYKKRKPKNKKGTIWHTFLKSVKKHWHFSISLSICRIVLLLKKEQVF